MDIDAEIQMTLVLLYVSWSCINITLLSQYSLTLMSCLVLLQVLITEFISKQLPQPQVSTDCHNF